MSTIQELMRRAAEYAAYYQRQGADRATEEAIAAAHLVYLLSQNGC